MIETRRASRIRPSVAPVGFELLKRRSLHGEERHVVVGEMEDRAISACGAMSSARVGQRPDRLSRSAARAHGGALGLR
jgi:hypothetical protein